MNRARPTSVLCLIVCFAVGGCEKSQPPVAGSTVRPPTTQTATPEGSTPAADASSATPKLAGKLALTGLTMTVPKGWQAGSVGQGMFKAVAAFRLPRSGDDAADCEVRITYYPNMKGMDDRNIDRWLGSMSRPDGSPSTRDHAKITTTELGAVRLTVVEVDGSLRQGMTGSGGSLADQRLVAAIVDHPDGPHFIKISGGAASMNQWAASIDAFLKSATAN